MGWARGSPALLTLIVLAPCVTPPAPHRAEGVECAGAVRPERTVAVVESAFALPALVSGASGGASSGVACG